MCGIAGSYQIHPSHAAAGDRIQEALQCIAHRGPDDEGVYRNGRAILGHRRLSILDTSAAGHQPFTDDGGRYTIVFNGEVFNFLELRRRLEAEGHTFRSRTDTEVILRLFALKGPEFLHDLNGFFALAIHDAEEDTLVVARDRFGIKPLFWAMHDGHFLFGSELRALHALGQPKDIDRVSLRQYFGYHYIAAPHTILPQVHKLMPGDRVIVNAAGVTTGSWYDPMDNIPTRNANVTPERTVRELLDDAVRLRLISDVPIGTFLSGGLDSSIISALAAVHHADLRTFSIGYADDPYYDESRYADEVAAHIGSTHDTFTLTREDLADAYPRLLKALDEPFADSSALPAFILCERTRKHVKVALSGDGADEVFGGYRKHQALARMGQPGFAERMVTTLAPLWRSLPRSRNSMLPDLFRRFDRFAAASQGTPAERWIALARIERQEIVDGLLADDPASTSIAERERAMAAGVDRLSGMNGALLADVLTVLPNDMLYKVDLTSMAHGLEVRPPFLDKRVVEFAFSLRATEKFGLGEGKRILRNAFADLLPVNTIKRSKQGFEVPLRELFLGPLASFLDAELQPDTLAEAGFRPQAIVDLRTRLASSDPGGTQATLHAVLVYLTWFKRGTR